MFRKLLLPFFLVLFIVFAGCKNDPPSPPVVYPDASIGDVNTTEQDVNHTVELEVTLSGPLNETIEIGYRTTSGSAVAGQDFVEAEGTLIFEPGDLRELITITIIGDLIREELETFVVELVQVTQNVNLYKRQGIVSIADTDTNNDTVVIPAVGFTSAESYEGYDLVWQDEFDGETLDTDTWLHEIGTGSNGWGNNELQYYTNQNTSIVEGNLVITARKENFGGRGYTSSRIITRGRQEFQYGRIDIRAVLPQGQGIWPALWMLGSNFGSVGWPACGEIDIMEMIGGSNRENTVHGTVHWSNNGSYASYGGHTTTSRAGSFQNEFNVYSIIWDASAIRWLVNDQQYHTIDITPEALSEFRQEFFFIFNVAVGGNWPGSPNTSTFFPQYMIVDYVRVFQKSE